MLTQLTSLSLIRNVDSARSFKGISFLTNLRSFSWNHRALRDLPWDPINSLPSLRCLTVAGPAADLPLPVAGMTTLEMLEVESRSYKGWWLALESFTAVDYVTKLTCRDWTHFRPSLTPLQSFTALQHLVLIRGADFQSKHSWEELGLMTWVTKLELRGIIVEGVNDAYASLMKTLGAISQLVSLSLTIRFMYRDVQISTDATVAQVLTKMNSLSSLVS